MGKRIILQCVMLCLCIFVSLLTSFAMSLNLQLASPPRRVRLYYSTVTGNTGKVSHIIAEACKERTGVEVSVTLIDDCKSVDDCDIYIFGAPTLNTGADSDRTGTSFDEWAYLTLPNLDFKSKRVAVFGLGNCRGYSFYFCDAVGELYDYFQNAGAEMYGDTVDPNDYNYESSYAERNGKLVGMLFDEENESDKHLERAQNWLATLSEQGFFD